MCKGGGSTTQTSTTGPPPQVLQNYQDVYSQAANLAASGLGAQTYPGQTVAPFSSNQEWAINNPFAAQQVYGGYANTAQNYYQAATQPLWNQGVSSAFQEPINIAGQNLGAATQANLSPYIQSVVDATQAQFNNQNAIQQQGVIGNAISSNAWGGDRSGVAQGITAGQQQLAEAPVIAGLYNQGYQTAQQATLAQMQQQEAAGEAGAQAQLGAGEANAWLNSQAASGMSNVGTTEAGLVQGALSNATQLGALQQQQAQANLNVPYANWLQQTSYPYQATNWLANISEGIGGLSGGTGTTTTPGPSTGSQLAGLGIGGVGLLGATGAFGSNGYLSNLFNGGGGGPSSFLIPGSDTSIGAASFLGSSPFHRGGSVRYGIGGSPQPLSSPTGLPMGSGLPMGDTIPNLSISIVPQTNAPTASRSPFIGLGPQTTTQTQQSGSGGIGSAISTGLGIAKLATLFDRGGGIHGYDEGGDVDDLSAPSAGMPPPIYGGAPGANLTPSEGIAPYHADPWMALAAAGFGAAAGRSPHALQNIGQGALEGMQFYESQRRYEPEARLKGAQAQQAEIQVGLTKAGLQAYQNQSQQSDLDLLTGNVHKEQQVAKTSPATAVAPAAQQGPAPATGPGPLLSDVVASGGTDKLVDRLIQREGGSPKGVENNPGNIKFAGLPGQVDSGVQATDGGTFASYASPDAGRQAVAGLVTHAASGQSQAYGSKPTVNSFMDVYGGHTQLAQNTRGQMASDANPPMVQVPIGGGGQTISMPSVIGDGRNPAFDHQYAQILRTMPLLLGNPAAYQAAQANLTRLFDQDWRVQAQRAEAVMRAQKGVELQANPEIAGKIKQAEIAPSLALKGGEAAIDVNKAQQMVPIQGQAAAAEAEGKLPFTPGTARPGSYTTLGGVPIGSVPQLRETVDPNTGAKSFVWDTPPLPGAANAQAGQPGLPSQLGPGQRESLVARAKDEQELRDMTIKEAQSAQYQQSTLQRLKDDADQMYTGPFASHVQNATRMLRLIDPRFNGQVASYEDFVKNAGSLTRTATREASPRAAFQEMRFIEGTLPNPDMSPQGLRSVTDEYMGLNDYKQAKAKAQTDWEMAHGGLGHVEGFEPNWQANAPVTPYTFILNRMDRSQRQELFAKWNQTAEGRAEIQRLHEQGQYAINNGLMR